MPTIDNRSPCKELNCRSRAVKSGLCDDHLKTSSILSDDRHKFYNATKRDPLKGIVYRSHRWRKLSKRMIETYPLCTRCYAKGRIKGAQLTDHLVGFIDETDPHAWDESFLYPLCKKCHAIVTALEKHNNFLEMSLQSAVFLKYDGAMIRTPKEIIL